MKIVIVGGGATGWIAANFFSRVQKEIHDVVIVDSSKLPIIGVGEATSGRLYDLLNNRYFPMETSVQEFLEKTDSVKRYGVLFKNWNKSNTDFIKPFDIPRSINAENNNFNESFDTLIYAYQKYGPSKIHTSSFMGLAIEHGVDIDMHGFQSDAKDMANFFKDLALNKKNVKHVDAIVSSLNLNDQGFIKEIILDDGSLVTGDLFIDCSGFKRILANKMDMGWISYKKYLPVNSVITFRTELEKKPSILTKVTAMSNGWMFNLETKKRIGNGYIYDNNYISEEEAKKEVETLLDIKIETSKAISFEPGRLEKFWSKNCVAFGLSSFFIEPLSGSSIAYTITQLAAFTQEFLKENFANTYSKKSEYRYNDLCIVGVESSLSVTSLAYKGKKDHNDFWKYMNTEESNTDFISEFLERSSVSIPGDISVRKNYVGDSRYNFFLLMLLGLEIVSKDHAKKELERRGTYNIARDKFESFFESFHNTYYVNPEDIDMYDLQKNIPYGKLINNYKQRRNI